MGQPGPNFTVYWLRTVLDLSFFLIVITLGLNLVIAILVDSFSELRSERVRYYSYYTVTLGIRDFGFYFPKNSGGLNRVLLFLI